MLSLETCNKHENKDAMNYYSAGLYKLDKYFLEQAVRDFNTALHYSNGKNYRIYLMRGIAYLEMNQYHQAIIDLTISISLNPLCCDAFNNRGYAYFKLGNYTSSIIDFMSSIKMNPYDEFVKKMCVEINKKNLKVA